MEKKYRSTSWRYNLLEIKTNKLVDSLFVWNYKTCLKSRWIEFADFREYAPWDNIKNIDFVRSQNEWKILVKLQEEERELSVYFIIQLDESIESNFWKKSKKETILELIYLLSLSAIKWWDKIWAYIFSGKEKKLLLAKKWKSSLINIVNNFDEFLNEIKFSDINDGKKALSNFNSLKINKSLVVYITSQIDIDEKQLKILALKNDLIVCNVFNSFENNLESSWIKWFKNWPFSFFLDLDDSKKREEFKQLRIKNINNFKNKVIKYSWKYLMLDETSNIYLKLLKLMKEKY